jgi:hypothetical protein
LPHPRRGLQIRIQRESGHVSDERLIAEQHGFGQWQQSLAEFMRTHCPAAAESRRGMGFGDGGDRDHPVGEVGVVERRGEVTVKHQLLINLVRHDPEVVFLADRTDTRDFFSSQHRSRRVVR